MNRQSGMRITSSLRWQGLLALNFIRRTELPPYRNVFRKHGTPETVVRKQFGASEF